MGCAVAEYKHCSAWSTIWHFEKHYRNIYLSTERKRMMYLQDCIHASYGGEMVTTESSYKNNMVATRAHDPKQHLLKNQLWYHENNTLRNRLKAMDKNSMHHEMKCGMKLWQPVCEEY